MKVYTGMEQAEVLTVEIYFYNRIWVVYQPQF
jgi:uncharacterized membrane protein